MIGPYYSSGNRRLIDHNIANARYVMVALINYFAESRLAGPFSPFTHTAQFEVFAQAPESYYHELDDAFYDNACHAFILLPDWQNSKGAVRDRQNAYEQRKPVFELKSYSESDIKTLLCSIEKWALPKKAA